MTKDEILALPRHSPILLNDGSFGIVISIGREEIGVQVPGKKDVIFIMYNRVRDLGDGALREMPDSLADVRMVDVLNALERKGELWNRTQ